MSNPLGSTFTRQALGAECSLGFPANPGPKSNIDHVHIKRNIDTAPGARQVAIMATAAVCKLQEAVTIALGKEKWQSYEQDHFPKRGKALNDLEEVLPILYKVDPSKNLVENQEIWAAKTRELIEQLERQQ